MLFSKIASSNECVYIIWLIPSADHVALHYIINQEIYPLLGFFLTSLSSFTNMHIIILTPKCENNLNETFINGLNDIFRDRCSIIKWYKEIDSSYFYPWQSDWTGLISSNNISIITKTVKIYLQSLVPLSTKRILNEKYNHILIYQSLQMSSVFHSVLLYSEVEQYKIMSYQQQLLQYLNKNLLYLCRITSKKNDMKNSLVGVLYIENNNKNESSIYISILSPNNDKLYSYFNSFNTLKCSDEDKNNNTEIQIYDIENKRIDKFSIAQELEIIPNTAPDLLSYSIQNEYEKKLLHIYEKNNYSNPTV